MLTLEGLTSLINDKDRKIHKDILNNRQVYYGMSLHIDGACPRWTSLRDNRLGWVIGNFIEKEPLMGWYGLPYQEIFDIILFNRYPNEKEITRQWRFSQYKPFQKAFFGKAISMTTGAIFQDSGYSITLEDKEDNDYIWGNNFSVTHSVGTSKTNLVNYFAAHFKSIAEDPNGYFLVLPRESREGTTTQRIEPDVWFICSKHIHWITDDEIVFERGEYRWAVNKFGYFRWRKEGAEWVLVEKDGYYGHFLGYIPIFVAGGVWNSQGFYDSWLVDGKAIADDYVIIKSDEAMCAKQASHPWIIEASEDCPDCQHTGKMQFCLKCNKTGEGCSCDDSVRQLTLQNCNRCSGTGIISHNPGDRLIAPKDDMEHALIQVVNVPVDANEMHAKRAEQAELNLQKALHLNYIDQAQSKIAKDKDMETRYQYILTVSNDYFDRLIPSVINSITAIRNIKVSNGLIVPTPVDMVIVKPTQFQIKTSFDLLEELKEADSSGIPPYQKGALLVDYVDKQFGGNDYLKKKTIIINQMDVISNTSEADISIKLLNNGIEHRKYQLHNVLPSILDQINREKTTEWFLNASYDQIKVEVDRIFTEQYPPIPEIRPDVTDERINV